MSLDFYVGCAMLATWFGFLHLIHKWRKPKINKVWVNPVRENQFPLWHDMENPVMQEAAEEYEEIIRDMDAFCMPDDSTSRQGKL